MTAAEKSRLHASISGRVQGVGFRAFVLDQARLAGVTGWVRNRWDDTVEVVAEGERGQLDRLLAALRRGPPASYVSDVQVGWSPASGEFNRFSVYPTG